MTTARKSIVVEKLDRLRTELVDLAFALENRGRVDAADVAMMTSARIEELREELLVETTKLAATR